MADRKKQTVYGWTLLVVLGLCAAAVAQGPWGGQAGGGQGGQGQGNRPGGMGMGMGMPGMGMPMMGMPPGANNTPVIAVATDCIYVVISNRIFRLDPKTLAVLAQKDLPMPTPQMPGMPGGGMPGGGMPGGGMPGQPMQPGVQ
ncbi:MAG: hypothetical protein HZB16_05575 [Armatimonadetes bacterium]|nr:hypothetical protein [Armatimonadota bacterium]